MMRKFVPTAILALSLAAGPTLAEAHRPNPKRLIQGFYAHLYENYKPGFVFSEEDPVSTCAAVAYVFLDGHRDEYQGKELSSPIIRRSIERVRAAQTEDGSFGQNGASTEERLAATAAAVLALRAARNADYADAITKATKWLQAQPDAELPSSIQFAKLLAVKGEQKIQAEDANRLLKLAADMMGDTDLETVALGYLCSARLRQAAELVQISEGTVKELPDWNATTAKAAETLQAFMKAGNVRGACISARTLHYCHVAETRQKKQ